jgi:putative transposase
LWRAVDQEGEVLENYIMKKHDKMVALKFFRKVMRKHGRPEVLLSDQLRSYGASLRQSSAPHTQEAGRWVNDRAENSQLPFRRR